MEPEARARAEEASKRALLNERWEATSRRIAEHVRGHGQLLEGELSEDQIAEIAVRMVNETPTHRAL